MTGEQLYERWRDAMAAEGIAADPWEDVEEIEKDAWDRCAADLEEVRA